MVGFRFSFMASFDLYFTELKFEPSGTDEPTWTLAPQDIYYKPIQQYYLSTSATTPTGRSWTETQPTWEPGKYLWERLRLVWSDGRATPIYHTVARHSTGAGASECTECSRRHRAQNLANRFNTMLDRYMTLTDDKGWEFHANIIYPNTGEEVPSIWLSRIDE